MSKCQCNSCECSASYVVHFDGRFGKQHMEVCEGHYIIYEVIEQHVDKDHALEYVCTLEMVWTPDIATAIFRRKATTIGCPDIFLEKLSDNKCRVHIKPSRLKKGQCTLCDM